MSGNPWIRFFPSDWLAGTRGMTAAESGIYITLIALMYERGGEIENNPPRLCRLCGSSNSSFKKVLETLISERKITLTDGLLTNKRVVEELSYTREKSSVARASAKSRWGKKPNKNNTDIDASAMQTQCGRNANQKPEAREKDKPKKVHPKSGLTLCPIDFHPKSKTVEDLIAEGGSHRQIEAARVEMIDWSRGGGKMKRDWDATLRNWVRRNFPPNTNVRDPPPSTKQSRREEAMAATKMDFIDED